MTNLNNTNDSLAIITEKYGITLLNAIYKEDNTLNFDNEHIIDHLITPNIFINYSINDIYNTIKILLKNEANIHTKTLNKLLSTNIYNKLTQLLIREQGDIFFNKIIQDESTIQSLIQQYPIMDVLFKEIPLKDHHRQLIYNIISKSKARIKKYYFENSAWNKLIIINDHLILSKIKEPKNNSSKITKI